MAKKLAILCRLYPKVCVLWSTSPQNTVEIFSLLAKGQTCPDISKASKIGKSFLEDDEGSKNMPLEFLNRLLGINSAIVIGMIKRYYRNLIEVANASKEELCNNIGNDDGNSLHKALHEELKVNISMFD